MTRSTRLRIVVVAVVTALTLAGCGSGSGSSDGSGTSRSSETSGDGSTTASPTPSTNPPSTNPPSKKKPSMPTLRISFKGDKVTPQGESLEVKAGKPLRLIITADQGGELHVHSSPEQEIEYSAGTSRKSLTIEQPGVVDVESHDLHQLIVQLEVR